jgi:hypothetical protein
MQDLSTLRTRWTEIEAEETRLLREMTVAESLHQFAILYEAYAPRLRPRLKTTHECHSEPRSGEESQFWQRCWPIKAETGALPQKMGLRAPHVFLGLRPRNDTFARVLRQSLSEDAAYQAEREAALIEQQRRLQRLAQWLAAHPEAQNTDAA